MQLCYLIYEHIQGDIDLSPILKRPHHIFKVNSTIDMQLSDNRIQHVLSLTEKSDIRSNFLYLPKKQKSRR